MNSDKEDFITNVAFGITLMGTAQRGKLYREGATDPERDKFRIALHAALENLSKQYRSGVTEDQHLANINNLADELSQQHANALNKSRFRIGSAQKALNLYLKLLWCFDRIPIPPHCPFDSIVLSNVPSCEHVKWTHLDSLPEYQHIVNCARAAANGVSLAEWELRLYTTARFTGRVSDIT